MGLEMPIDDGFRYSYARKLKKALLSGEFRILSSEPYQNESFQWGMEYVCEYKGRKFFLSEARTDEASDALYFLRALGDTKDISQQKPLIWANRRGEPCLYLEVWYLSRWHKFHTPIFHGPLDDEFVDLIRQAIDWSNRK